MYKTYVSVSQPMQVVSSTKQKQANQNVYSKY